MMRAATRAAAQRVRAAMTMATPRPRDGSTCPPRSITAAAGLGLGCGLVAHQSEELHCKGDDNTAIALKAGAGVAVAAAAVAVAAAVYSARLENEQMWARLFHGCM